MLRLILFSLIIIASGSVYAWFALNGEPSETQDSRRFKVVLSQAQDGDVQSQAIVGDFYREGKGVAANPAQALDWLAKAAVRGHTGAQYALGRMYEKGPGTEIDYSKAARWYKAAAELGGHPDAQYALGRLYFNGRGVLHDYAKAVKWYRRAADQGHPDAQYIVGSMYQGGWGVRQDIIKAYMWFSLALRHLNGASPSSEGYDPKSALAGLELRMNNLQIKRAQELTEAWVRSAAAAASTP